VGARLLAQAVLETLPGAAHRVERVGLAQDAERGQSPGHRCRRHPERTGREDAVGALAQAVGAEQGPERMPVGKRLAPCAEVWPHAERLPAAAQVEPRTAADLVDHQDGADAVADRPQPLGELGGRRLEVAVDVVADRGYDDRRHVVGIRRVDGRLDRRKVVVLEQDRVGVVLRRRARRVGAGRPARDAVVGTARQQHLAPPGRRPGHDDPERRGVRAVLAEHRPIRVGHLVHEHLAELHHQGRRPVQDVAHGRLRRDRLLDARVAVPEQDRSPRAHQVDVLVAVHVPDTAALTARVELRVLRREERGVEMPVHPAGHHPRGALAQRGVQCANALDWQSAHDRVLSQTSEIKSNEYGDAPA
jgi:hypothetical protein